MMFNNFNSNTLNQKYQIKDLTSNDQIIQTQVGIPITNTSGSSGSSSLNI